MNRRTRCGAALLLAVAALVAAPTGPVAAGVTGGATLAAAVAEPVRPLTDADRDLVVRVRLAGLWEIPAGRMAEKKGSTARVREVGALIAAQHVQLDRLAVTAARRLGLALPDEPSPEQAYWLREMAAADGPAFDRVFAQRLREAHGRIFPAIAAVRAGTRDPVVRKLANDANGFVKNHLDLLDSTGAVDYDHLTPLTEPAAEEHRFVLLGDPRHPGGAGTDEQVRQAVVALTGGLAALLGLVLVVRVLFPARGTRVVRPPEPAAPPHRRQQHS
jgi:predicted outer membrane protein